MLSCMVILQVYSSLLHFNIFSNPSVYDKKIEEHVKGLKFILEKDLMTDFYNCSEDINYKIAVLERKKLEVALLKIR